MKTNTANFSFLSVLSFAILSACSHGQCTNIPQRPPAASGAQPTFESTPSTGKTGTSGASDEAHATVLVYKDTGELQCGQGKAVKLDVMAKQLTSRRIRVLSSRTQDDGLMHVQVCGSPTGKINVYEIPASSLRKALRTGFKESAR